MKRCLLLVLIFSSSFCFAQLTSGEFTIGGNGVDGGSSVIQTKDGGYAIAGNTSSFGANAENMYVIKLDSNANIEWTKVISDTIKYEHSNANSIVNTKDGGIALVGSESNVVSGLFFVKLDYSGNLLWTKTYSALYYYPYSYSMIRTRDGGFAIAGSSGSEVETSSIFILKLDSVGNIQWSNNLTTAKEKYPQDYGNSIIQASDDGYVISGIQGTSSTSHMYIAKLDSTGKVVWGRGTNSANGAGESVVQTSDSGLVILGNTSGSNSGINLYKLNTTGDIIWSEILNSHNCDGYSLINTADDGFAIAGSANRGGGDAIYFAKLNSVGHVQWNRIIGGGTYYPYTYSEGINSVIQTRDKGFALAGVSVIDSIGSLKSDEHVLFLKIDSAGGICSYDTVSTSYLPADLLYSNDSTFTNTWTVSSKNYLSSGGIETSVCFPYTLGIQSLNQSLQKVAIFPNPNNGVFTVTLSHPELVSGSQTIEVYNILGEKIYSTPSTPSPNGEGWVRVIDLSSQPNGIYLIRVLTNERVLVGQSKVVKEE